MILIDPNIIWRTLDMGDEGIGNDKFSEVVSLLSKLALNSFMGAYILLDNKSKSKYNLSFVELLLRDPERGCALGKEIFGDQFTFLIRSILKRNEFNGIRDSILSFCNKSERLIEI